MWMNIYDMLQRALLIKKFFQIVAHRIFADVNSDHAEDKCIIYDNEHQHQHSHRFSIAYPLLLALFIRYRRAHLKFDSSRSLSIYINQSKIDRPISSRKDKFNLLIPTLVFQQSIRSTLNNKEMLCLQL
jgi:hypothetical protein